MAIDRSPVQGCVAALVFVVEQTSCVAQFLFTCILLSVGAQQGKQVVQHLFVAVRGGPVEEAAARPRVGIGSAVGVVLIDRGGDDLVGRDGVGGGKMVDGGFEGRDVAATGVVYEVVELFDA